MTYQIESKSDLSGALLVVRFPERELDAKALYTIQADPPDFLVPFRFRCVDGEAECTYQLGGRSRLLYRCAGRAPGELVGFWERVLQPLLDCGDWFLKPFSFVLDARYLYTDREGRSVSYLYIPSKEDCSGPDALRELATELAQKNPSVDAELEVKVLRAIMQDFQPSAFLQMLREVQPSVLAQKLTPPVQAPVPPRAGPEAQCPPAAPEPPGSDRVPRAPEPPAPGRVHRTAEPQMDGDIQIHLSGGGKKPPKPKKEKKSLFGHKEKKEEKKEKKEGGLFGRKKQPDAPREIILGAAAEAAPPSPGAAAPSPAGSAFIGASVSMPEEEDGVTMILEPVTPGGCRFRLVGEPGLPREIPVVLEPGGVFTIGRFDVSVGRRQSDFEFEGKTKAVSRHHAAVERTPDGGYVLVDLDSAAGTFVGGERLTPNVARRLSSGDRVAFGIAGADYIWEE